MAELTPVGPWPLGVDNVSAPKDEVFAPPSQGKPAPPRLLEAENVDLSRTGGASRRPGWTKRLTLINAHSGMGEGSQAFVVNDGALSRLGLRSDPPTAEALVSGIAREVSYTEAEGMTWWVSGPQRGVLTGAGNSRWGIEAANPPSLSVGAGQLRAGDYLVALEVVDLDGLASGVREYAQISLPAGGGILVTPVGIDSQAATLRVYCSDANGEDPYFVKEVPVGPVLIDQVERTSLICKSLGLHAPPAGELVSYHSGRWLIASGAMLYWSMPGAPHHFRVELDAMEFPYDIQMIASQIDGFYVGTTDRTFWVAGSRPEDWRRTVVSASAVSFGDPKRLQGHKLPWLQFDGLVPSWMTTDGPAFGLPGGVIRLPTSGRVAIDGYEKAALAFREQDGLRQLMVAMRSKANENRLGVSDQFVAVRIPGA